MSINMYRRQVIQIRSGIAKLMEQKAREVKKAADAVKKSLNAQSAASKASSTSTLQTKLREASRHADDQAKHDREVAKLEKKIADEQKKLVGAQGRLDNEEAKAVKKRNDEQKRQQDAQQRQFRAVESSLTHHERLHRETIARLERLSALPDEIVVAFFATDPTTASNRRLLLDEEVREIQQKIRLSEHRDAVKLESRGFYPVTADTLEKRHNVPKECSCPNAENTALNSSAKPSRYLASLVPTVVRWP